MARKPPPTSQTTPKGSQTLTGPAAAAMFAQMQREAKQQKGKGKGKPKGR